MLENIPFEILHLILLDETLDFRDLISMASTSTYLKALVLSNNPLWKAKYIKRWPDIYTITPDIIQDYYAEVKYVFNIQVNVCQMLITLAMNSANKEHLFDYDFKPLMNVVLSRCLNREYVINYLKKIISDNSEINTLDVVPLTTPGNLTLKYYCLSFLRYLYTKCLSSKWHTFLSLPKDNQITEIVATMLTQWYKVLDEINTEDVRTKLDMIAEEVKNYLKQQNPGHPLFKITESVCSEWREKYLHENQFSTKHCREILMAIKIIFYDQMGFHHDQANYPHINSCLITGVLESRRGLSLPLSIIYESIARRFGVNLDLVNCTEWFMLRFTDEERTGISRIYYIDVLNKGKMYTAQDCPHIDANIASSRMTTKEVIEETWSIMELALYKYPSLTFQFLKLISEFDRLLKLHDEGVIISQEQFLPPLNVSPTQQCFSMPSDDIDKFRKILEAGPLNMKKRVAYRNPEILYAVGMIVQHIPDNGTYVIFGWDYVCESHNLWQRQKSASRLKNGLDQPFYHLAGERGKRRYAAQENIRIKIGQGGVELNDKLGRFFTHFYKTHYVPNSTIHDEYPEDEEVRKRHHLELLRLSMNV